MASPLRAPARESRAARRQVDSPVPYDGGGSQGEEYNIWYHKHCGGREYGHLNKRKHRATTRCNLAVDSGFTRADDMQVPYVCLHFARGCCFLGEQCTYLHRKPVAWDQARLDVTHDIFGRERHRDDRADMGGVGSMQRTNKTLYVNYGGASSYGDAQLKEILHRTFSEYGEVERINVISAKNIAFVNYKIRASSEFAKECLSNQSLSGSTANEILDVRWAYDDQNPVAVIRKKRKAEEDFASAVQDRMASVPDEQRMAHDLERTHQYPNTDASYGGGPAAGAAKETSVGEGEEDDIGRYDFDDDPYYDSPVEEEEVPQPEEPVEASEPRAPESKPAKENANALGLLAGYGSDDDDEEEE